MSNLHLLNEYQTPLMKEVYRYLNQQNVTADHLQDFDNYQLIAENINKGLIRLIIPYIKNRPDLRERYQTADFKVRIFDTLDGVRLCVLPIFNDLALDLENVPMTLVQNETYVPMELPFV